MYSQLLKVCKPELLRVTSYMSPERTSHTQTFTAINERFNQAILLRHQKESASLQIASRTEEQ